ncbi:hypothetical protein HPB48_027031 [Haemaphysalis longicornis]|uniref:Uncharacterized protein n=1 Tax=Haemaphysalis longicornis TaxID=44386 RepID=A0A9J6HB59_HAELO|nr:hypothetical protein HPB48_027031 [Haemaphysalis longicornis]
MAPPMQQLINELKDELRAEIKNVRETVERDLRAEMRDFRTEFRDEAKSIEYFNKVFEEIEKDYKTIKAHNETLKEQNTALRTECDALTKRLVDAESRLVHSEQYSRSNNIEIKGIEQKPGEDVVEIVQKLGTLADVPVTPDDIEACHRVPSKAKPNCIVVQFARRQKRDALLDKARKLRLNNKDFGNTTNSPVYVNDHLCPVLKRLLGTAVAKKKAAGWKYVWSRGGKIYAKQTDDSVTVVIRHERDLEKIE